MFNLFLNYQTTPPHLLIIVGCVTPDAINNHLSFLIYIGNHYSTSLETYLQTAKYICYVLLCDKVHSFVRAVIG